MKKKMNLRLDLVRLIPVCALGMAITLLLPWLHTVQTLGAVTHNGLDLVKSQNLLHMTPLTAAGVAAILLSVIALLKPSKALLIAVAAALSACVLSGVYALLTLKRAADASGLLTQAFLMRDLGPGLWLYLILAVVGLFLTLRAMREPIEYIVLTVMASVWLLPIVWLVLTAFRQESGAYTPYIMPKGYTWNNFTRLFTETAQFSFPRWYLNTLVVAVFTCVFTTAMVLMISYTFSRLRFPARKKLMNIGLILGMFPAS